LDEVVDEVVDEQPLVALDPARLAACRAVLEELELGLDMAKILEEHIK
jgi:hypothetical protein